MKQLYLKPVKPFSRGGGGSLLTGGTNVKRFISGRDRNFFISLSVHSKEAVGKETQLGSSILWKKCIH